MEDEKEGSNPTTNSKGGGDCDYELLTKIIINDKNPKKSTLHIHCRQISSRAVFEDYFTPNQLQKAGFAGIRSFKQLDKAKNLIDTAFVSSDKEISLDIQIIDKQLIEKFLETNDSDDEEEDDKLNEQKHDNDDGDDGKEEELKLTEQDLKNKVIAIHLIIIKEDHFMLLECKLILPPVPRKETEVLREIIEEMKHQLLPVGSIIMWGGHVKNIPPGWALCDGTNNTPDLRDRFIVGSGGKYTNGDVGGKENHKHQVTVAPHLLTLQQIPNHSHTFTYNEQGTSSKFTGSDASWALISRNTKSKSTAYVGGNQAHAHGSSCREASNVPPYFAMCFIMLQSAPKYSI